jgi:hypothetical protein
LRLRVPTRLLQARWRQNDRGCRGPGTSPGP